MPNSNSTRTMWHRWCFLGAAGCQAGCEVGEKKILLWGPHFWLVTNPIYDTNGDDSREENGDFAPLGQPCLVGACAEILIVICSYVCLCIWLKSFNFWSLLEVMKALEISSHPHLKFCVKLHVIFQLQIMLLVLEIVWNSKIFSSNIMSHFQLSNSKDNFIFLKFHLILHPFAS